MSNRNIDLTFRDLVPSDIDAARALYELVFCQLQHGFLAKRTANDFAEGLANAPDRVAIGAFSEDALVGYSMCRIAYRDDLTDFPLLRRLRQEKQEYWTGGGTVVDPRFRGHGLMARLLQARIAAAREKGVAHSLALVAIGNHVSLAGTLRAGFRIVGLEEDEYCLNYLCYEGSLTDDLRTSETRKVHAEEIDVLATAFADGWIATGVNSGAVSGPCMLTLER